MTKKVAELIYPTLSPVNFPKSLAVNELSTKSLKGFRELDSAPEKTKTDNWWALKNTRVVKAWQTAASKGEGVRIALPGAPVTPHFELEDNAVLHDLALTASPSSIHAVHDASVREATALASVIVSRQVGQIAGSAPAGHVLPLNCASKEGVVNADDLASALETASSNDCQVVCIAHPVGESDALKKSIDAAIKNNIIVVCSSGDKNQTEISVAHDIDVITVAGSTSADDLWSNTISGPFVDFAAPAEGVWGVTADNDTSIAPFNGTAFAAGLTSGIAALWIGHHGSTKLARLASDHGTTVQTLFKKAVLATSRQPNGWDQQNAGCGIIDADALMRLDLDFVAGS